MIPQHTKRHRAVTSERGIRAAVAITAALLGANSVSATLANVLERGDPALAYDLETGNGHITAAAAEHKFTLTPNASADSIAASLAHRALQQDATAVEALSVLGLQAQLRGDVARARVVFGYSHRLSRRELRTQIWAIEEAVLRGDIAGALKQYDQALRTSQKAREILFPVLARAIADPAVRAATLKMMSSESAWGEAFINYVAANGPEPRAVVAFFRDGAAVGLPIEDDDRSRLVNALVAEGATEDAWGFYESYRPSVSRYRSRDPDFRLNTQVPAVFDWSSVNADGVSASIHWGENGGVVHFSAAPGAGGTVIRQAQMLPPGKYRLKARSRGTEQPEYSRPYWTLTCRNGRELGRVPLLSAEDIWQNHSGRFTVPPNCSFQDLSLIVRATDDIAGVEGRIGSIELTPIS